MSIGCFTAAIGGRFGVTDREKFDRAFFFTYRILLILLLLHMPIDDIRAKQRADQTKAIKSRLEAGSIVRIGNRIPITGRYEVLDSDGGISNNGVKVYNAQEQYGDRVLAYPRGDDTIALDSEKGSIVRPPTAFPVCPGYLAGQVFNCEEPKKKIGKIWILYFFEGKLWVGGHQEQPEEVGDVHLYGVDRAPIVLESDGGPSVLGYRDTSNLHVWGDAAGWHVTYQTFPYPNQDFNNSVTFHSATSDSHKKYSTSFGFSQDGGVTGNNQEATNYNERSFPLGAGFVSYRSMRDISEVNPPPPSFADVYQDYSTVQQVTIGYLENAVPTVHQFSSGESYSAKLYDGIILNEIISYSGTIPIPNLDSRSVLPYSGTFSSPEAYENEKGPYFNNERPQRVVLPVLTVQSVHNYAILCDRFSTYYIQESININASPSISTNANSSIQKVYELRSTDSPSVIARNTIEPRFFGIRWDIRASAQVEGAWDAFFGKTSKASGYHYVNYSDPAYFYPTYNFNATYQWGGVMPVGHFSTLEKSYLPFNEYFDYPYFATFSGGRVVTVASSEINKAKSGGAELQRQSIEVDGTKSDLGTVFCYPIPATAIVYHWSTTA